MTAAISTTGRNSFLAAIAAAQTPEDRQATRRVYADWLDEQGHAEEATTQRQGAAQQTEAGDEVVTVARDGARMANVGPFSVPIYCTAVYVAVRRRRDGVLTWRRATGGPADGTSGHAVTPPMAARAKAYAASTGRRYAAGIRHGKVCR